MNLEPVKEIFGELYHLIRLEDVEVSYLTPEDMENTIIISLEGEGMGKIIGNKGSTLQAIQHVFSMILKSRYPDYETQVIIDAGHYMQDINDELKVIADDAQEQARSSNLPVDLPPMDAYRRKILHTYLATKYKDVSTESFGEGEDRFVRISVNTN